MKVTIVFLALALALVANPMAAEDVSCVPPSSGDREIVDNCVVDEDMSAPADVTISGSSTVTVDGFHLDIDFLSYNLTIESGSKIIIKNDGKVGE